MTSLRNIGNWLSKTARKRVSFGVQLDWEKQSLIYSIDYLEFRKYGSLGFGFALYEPSHCLKSSYSYFAEFISSSWWSLTQPPAISLWPVAQKRQPKRHPTCELTHNVSRSPRGLWRGSVTWDQIQLGQRTSNHRVCSTLESIFDCELHFL